MDASADLICLTLWPLFSDEETEAKGCELVNGLSNRLVTGGGDSGSPGSQAIQLFHQSLATLSQHLMAAAISRTPWSYPANTKNAGCSWKPQPMGALRTELGAQPDAQHRGHQATSSRPRTGQCHHALCMLSGATDQGLQTIEIHSFIFWKPKV